MSADPYFLAPAKSLKILTASLDPSVTLIQGEVQSDFG